MSLLFLCKIFVALVRCFICSVGRLLAATNNAPYILFDIFDKIRIFLQERLCLLAAYAKLGVFIGVRVPRLGGYSIFQTRIKGIARDRDALVLHNIKLRDLKRRRHLILHDFCLRPVADDAISLLDLRDAAYLDSHG